jgi:hypothetical protein
MSLQVIRATGEVCWVERSGEERLLDSTEYELDRDSRQDEAQDSRDHADAGLSQPSQQRLTKAERKKRYRARQNDRPIHDECLRQTRACPATTITVEIAPGPESIGMARGVRATSSLAWPSTNSSRPSCVRRSPRSMSIATNHRMSPPAVRKAARVIPKARKAPAGSRSG